MIDGLGAQMVVRAVPSAEAKHIARAYLALASELGLAVVQAVMDDVDLPTVLYFDETQGKLRAARGKGEATGVPDLPPDPVTSGFLPVLTVRMNPFRDICPSSVAR